MSRMPVSSLSWRPGALGAVRVASRPSYSLGQASPMVLVAEVVDVSGKPVKGVSVTREGGGMEAMTLETNSQGQAVFTARGRSDFILRAVYDQMVVARKVSSEEVEQGVTAFIQFPVCILGSLIRPIDVVIFGAAAGMIAAGNYWKIKPLEMTGEIAIGAAIFGFIYRLQCL